MGKKMFAVHQGRYSMKVYRDPDMPDQFTVRTYYLDRVQPLLDYHSNCLTDAIDYAQTYVQTYDLGDRHGQLWAKVK